MIVYLNHGDGCCNGLGYPCIVKPSGNGSSFGISIVYDESELEAALDEAFKFDNESID